MKLLLGFGLGLTIASLLLILWPSGRMNDSQVEKRARELGMVYRQEVITFSNE